MGKTRRAYGTWSQSMLRDLRDRGRLKVSALVAWLAGRDVHVDRTLVSHWTTGATHLPADLLPLLAEFCGHPHEVFGPYVRAVDCELVDVPASPAGGEDLVDLLLGAGASLGRLQQALHDARAPESPGGVAVTEEERAALRLRLDELIHVLADIRARLRAAEAPE